jgi:hypothetical protein
MGSEVICFPECGIPGVSSGVANYCGISAQSRNKNVDLAYMAFIFVKAGVFLKQEPDSCLVLAPSYDLSYIVESSKLILLTGPFVHLGIAKSDPHADVSGLIENG